MEYNVNLTQDEVELILQLLNMAPFRGVDTAKKVVQLYQKLNMMRHKEEDDELS